MILNAPIVWQQDPRWKNQRLGTVDGTTIGGYGCIISCMSSLASYYGHPITPDVMDNWLTDNQGYVQGNLYRNDAFPREFSDCSFDKIIFCTNIPAPLDQIDAYLDAKKPVVVMVDFDHNPANGVQTHFVLLVGKSDNGHYICNDPWSGDQTDFDNKYSDPATAINQINFFSGPIPQIPLPPISDPTAQPMKQIIIDSYRAICGVEPSNDEVQNRLNSGINTYDLINDLLNNDGRSPVQKMKGQIVDLQVLVNQVKAIIYGKGWIWTKISKLKQLLPQ